MSIVEIPSHPEGAERSSAAASLQNPATAVLNKRPVRLPIQSNAQSVAGEHLSIESADHPGSR